MIPRVVGEGRAIMQGKLTLAEAERRIRDNWHPYHDRLRALIAEARELYGMAILVDCHSMPHDALNAAPSVWGRRPDVILGDRFGAACQRWLIDAATELFSAQGFTVARNALFAGGYITQAYGRPPRGCRRCRSRSTARSTWTRRGSSGCRASPRSPPASAGWWRASPRWARAASRSRPNRQAESPCAAGVRGRPVRQCVVDIRGLAVQDRPMGVKGQALTVG